jgi:putative membrane protein
MSKEIIMRSKTISTITGLALLLSAGLAIGAESEAREQRGQFSEKDFKFVTDAARGGMSEVQLGELAKQRGESQAVRTFGERMATDHKKANDELKDLAAKKGAILPTSMAHKETSTFERLQKATGKEFDKVYAADMVKDHKKDVKEFQKAAKDSEDPDLKAFAQKTLPTLQEHLRMAQDMEAQVKR